MYGFQRQYEEARYSARTSMLFQLLWDGELYGVFRIWRHGEDSRFLLIHSDTFVEIWVMRSELVKAGARVLVDTLNLEIKK